ncbi:DUF268 domain-containing protein [Candidatus Peregrinibacteria bacterium]|jgi:SAM-dependent methyltransferase|nr:DUF268 domain-containing protein [Candidatus Peregrinibacteria bacterium]
MQKTNSGLKNFFHLLIRYINPFIKPFEFIRAFPSFMWFFRDWRKYKKIKGSENFKISDSYPCLHDKTETTAFDAHYFYQDSWAFKKIYESKSKEHVDIGSFVYFIAPLTAVTKVIFIDIRPLETDLENFISKEGSILDIPFDDNSVESLSSLHVAEHIGLGRYGDPVDPLGTKKSCQELARVLAPNGNLYFSLPIGKPRVCFNAHRIHSPKQIIDYFEGLKLVEISGVDDSGQFTKNIDISVLENCSYGCGLFHFTK